jgi:hypothetical protein
MEILLNKKEEFKCENCNKQYSSYKTLWTHNNKFHNKKSIKIKANPLVNNSIKQHNTNNEKANQFKCNKCNKSYKHQQSKWRHEKNCELEDKLIIIQKKLDQILIEKQEVKQENKKTCQEINGDHNIINSVNVINNFNNDNLSYITPDFFKNLLKETLFEEDHYKVLPKVIEEVKFNKEHTENNNVKLKDKSKYGEVYTEEGWKKIDDKKIIEHLVQKGYQLYVKLSDIHKDQIIKRYIDSNENFKDNFLNGTIENDVEDVMKETVIRGTKKIKKYDRDEREKELMKPIII